MTYLLIVYDLDAGRSLRMQEYEHSRPALEERFAEEAKNIPRREIIVLGGDVEYMKRTHSKYFAHGERPAASM